MIKQQDRKRKQDLGIFYTPYEVVDFVFEILNIWKIKQVARWENKEGKQKYPSVIDPAVGEGGFLKVALEKKFTKPDWIFGLDIDEKAVNKWKEINLLKEFGGKDKDLEAHFFHQNGLEKIKWEQHRDKYKYKLKQVDIENQQFDTVIGNPPYGGVGLGETELTDDLIAQLAKFEILPKSTKYDLNTANTQEDLFGSDKSFSLKPDAKQRIKSFPIEILFLERFIQLAKPGGWIAIIIPDGILTNSNSAYVREFIANKTKIEAIVSLPRNTFKIVGTTAKTSILFLRKLKENEKPSQDYIVFLSSTEDIGKENFQKILDLYQKFYNEEINMDKSELIQITKDQTGQESVIVRVDKTLQELMDEKPASRWNPNYWHPKYDENERFLKSLKFPLIKVNDIETKITYGAIITGNNLYQGDDLYLINQGDIKFTGLDLTGARRIKKDSPWNINRAKIQINSILLARSGVGGVGKNKITINVDEINAVVDSFVDILEINNIDINPYYLVVFWKTKYGWLQIERIINGVGTLNISFDEIREIVVPKIELKKQENIEKVYKKMYLYHNQAMEAKKIGNDIEYKQDIETAEKLLRKLISDTEAVIRGEKENIN